MMITKEHEVAFEAEHAGWKVFAKWDGCVEFRRNNVTWHVCDIEEFLSVVTATRDEMKRRSFEID